jgi:diaminohydroxyphosphoribosylaminopyrimidine deaminase/5-amino-6-(5-phosphoribosylamino)uracil reductase
LRRAGVEVISGVCRAEATALIAPFAKRIQTGMPYLTLKLAVTLDGRIADASGRSKWISGPQARAKVQALRRVADAILVGAGTVRADDPSLLPRPARGRTPWRVIVGTDIPAQAKVLCDEAAERTLVMNGPLEQVLQELAARGVMRVLCEGGGELAGSLVRAGLVDECCFFIAPALLGGDGVPMVGKKGWLLDEMPLFRFQNLEMCGKDVFIRAVPVGRI